MWVLEKIVGFVRSWYYPTYLSQRHLQMVPSLLERWGPTARVLNIGGGNQRYADNVITMDLFPSAATALAGDAHHLPYANGSFDAVLAVAVFEHLRRPWEAVQEIERVLKPGGEIYIEVPFMQPYHADPGDYYRYTIPGLRSLCGRFEEIEADVICGPGSALAWILGEFGGICLDRRGDIDTAQERFASYLFLGSRLIARGLFAPLKYLDRWMLDREHAGVLASGIYYRGCRPAVRKE